MDLISRQDVLDYIDTMPSELTSDGRRMIRRIRLTEYIADTLPSAERVGKWVPSHIPESILCECDQCGFDCGAYSFSYCPNCGARMEGGEE